MVSDGLNDYGEEWMQKTAFRRDLLVDRAVEVTYLLYLDSTDVDNDGNVEGDNLTDASDVGAITSEPGDGNYARITKTLDQDPASNNGDGVTITLNDSNNVVIRGQPSFDTTSTTGYVDAYAAIVSFQSTAVNSEAGDNPHLIGEGKIEGGALNLEQSTTVNVNADLTLN